MKFARKDAGTPVPTATNAQGVPGAPDGVRAVSGCTLAGLPYGRGSDDWLVAFDLGPQQNTPGMRLEGVAAV